MSKIVAKDTMGAGEIYRESFLGHNSHRSMEPPSRGKRRFAAEKLNIPLLMFCWFGLCERQLSKSRPGPS